MGEDAPQMHPTYTQSHIYTEHTHITCQETETQNYCDKLMKNMGFEVKQTQAGIPVLSLKSI